jgi:hypothetical protein
MYAKIIQNPKSGGRMKPVLWFFLFTVAVFGQKYVPSYQVRVTDQTILRSDKCSADLPLLKFEVKVSETGSVVSVKERRPTSIFLRMPKAVYGILVAQAKHLVTSWRFQPFFVDRRPVAIRTVVTVPCVKE